MLSVGQSAESSCTVQIRSSTSIGVGRGLKLQMTQTKGFSLSLPSTLPFSPPLSRLADKKVGKLEAFSSAW